MMKTNNNSNDIESGRPGFSSYGSLEESGHPTILQTNNGSPPPAMTPASSSSHSAEGLSMHVNDPFTQEDCTSSTSTKPAITTTSATTALSKSNDCTDELNNENRSFTWKDAMQNDQAAVLVQPTTTSHNNSNLENNDESNHNHRSHEHSHHPAHNEHLIKSRQYYRDMVLGVNDGLVSTFLLVAGVCGGGMDVQAILLTSISGAIAGAISMFAGEFVATKSQNEVMSGEIQLEKGHVKNYHAQEMAEVPSLLSLIGITASLHSGANDTENNTVSHTTTIAEVRELKKKITQYYSSNPDALLKIMIALELGVIDEEVRSPFIAGASSFSMFFVGALPSTIPFAFAQDPMTGMLSAGLATALGLLIVGAVKTWATRGNMWLAALENLLITVAGGGVAYGIGMGFQNLIGQEE